MSHESNTGSGQRDRVADALHGLPDPLLAIDGQRRLYYANDAAQVLLAPDAGPLPLPIDKGLREHGLARRLAQALGADGQGDAGLGNEFIWTADDNAWLVRLQSYGDGHMIWCFPERPLGALQERLETEHMRRFWAAALAGIGSWTWDIKENRLRSDAILAQLTGIDDAAIPADELFERVHPEDLPALKRAIQEAIESTEEEVELDSEFRFLPKDGGEIWLSMRGGVVRDSDGSPLMMSGVHFDVTERKQAEQALHKAKDALQEANRAKDSFLAKVSHEIRTPLTTILGYAELMTSRVGTDQERHNLGEILDSGRYLQSLVDDLLDLSRIIAGKVSISPQPVDLRHLGHELLSTMNMRAAEKRLGFSLNVSAGVPDQTESDPVRVRQILTNLIGNAVKFTEDGEVSVRIMPRNVDGSSFVAFEVRDTGPGIDPRRLRQLFEPFSQTRMSDAAQHGGLGLGLAISQRLAEVLGGHIEVESTPGKGSVFTLLLPVIEVRALERETPRNARAWDPDQDSQERLNARILAVDDVPAILSLLTNHLRTAGANVTTAADGLQALEAVKSAERAGKPFDALLMDLHMPHLDGVSTLQRLRDAGYHMPVIALSASAMKDDRDMCLRRGFTDFLSKPFNATQIVNAVSRVLKAGHTAPTAKPPAEHEHETLLVVEDHEALAELTGKQLASLGYTVETAHTGAAALDRAKALCPSAMIIDLTLPDMSGIDLCRALRQEKDLKDCRLIAYTGQEDPQVHKEARQAGFAGVLLKPANLGEFAALLEADTASA